MEFLLYYLRVLLLGISQFSKTRSPPPQIEHGPSTSMLKASQTLPYRLRVGSYRLEPMDQSHDVRHLWSRSMLCTWWHVGMAHVRLRARESKICLVLGTCGTDKAGQAIDGPVGRSWPASRPLTASGSGTAAAVMLRARW